MFRVPSSCQSPARQVLFECTPFSYPFGTTEARDLFKEWNQAQTECDGVTKILLLGCGDLRHALTTATGERGSHRLEIHLNDHSPSILARNVLMLSIITDENFNIEGDEDFKFLWDIWYNALWSESTSAKFIAKVKSLVQSLNGKSSSLPSNIKIPRKEDNEILTDVWRRWLAMFDSNGKMSAKFVKEVIEARKNFIIRGWVKLTKADKFYDANDATPFREATHGLAATVEHCFYEGVIPDEETKQKTRQELIYYFEHGYCFVGRQSARTKNTSVNPTLLDPVTKKWYVHYRLNPFEGFFNLFRQSISRVDTRAYKNEQAIMLNHSQGVLRNITKAYRKDCRDTVKFTFHLSDAIDFCLYKSKGTFDVIYCSNLSDNDGLANILVSARSRLSNHPEAAIITESIKWYMATTTVAAYVESAFGAPMSMLPTVSGLKVANSVELGAQKSRLLPLPASLIWKRCPEYRNVVLTPSIEMNAFFSSIVQLSALEGHVLEDCGMASYTLLTFHLIASDIIKRFGLTPNDIDPSSFMPFPDVLADRYRLQLRTLDLWAKGRRLSKFTSVVKDHHIFETGRQAFQSTHSHFFERPTPHLQIMLVPRKLVPSVEEFVHMAHLHPTPGVHVIDTFTFRFERNSDDPERLEAVHISFVLPEETTVELTHVAVAVQILKSYRTPAFYLGDIKSLRNEPFNEPYPIQSTQLPRDGQAKLKMIECYEGVNKYVVKFERDSKNKSKRVTFSADQELPCESAHVLNVSLGHFTEAYQFAHPFVSNRVILDAAANDTLTFTLPKAIYEPWPYQFRNAKKIDTDSLKPWRENTSAECQVLSLHLGTQFRKSEFQPIASSRDVVKMTPLSEVRQLIRHLLTIAFASTADEFLALSAGWASDETIWHLRVHVPIRIGPNGEPFVVITAIEDWPFEQIVRSGRVNDQKCSDAFTRIMINTCNGQWVKIAMPTLEGAGLFRYVMRLNGTKVSPNAWQKEHLVLKEDCVSYVIFPTYLSPLYGDGDFGYGKERAPDDAPIVQLITSSCCVTCGKQGKDLRKCSRCKSVSYCGTECQKNDWPRHKSNCKA